MLLLFCDSPAESLVDIQVSAVLLEVSTSEVGDGSNSCST